jgi:putative oxidoreductase
MIGFLVPIASLGIFCTMVVAVSRHLSHGDPFVGKGGSYELALLYGCVAFLLFTVGPGRFALDASWVNRNK